jgi:hypothetical protein
MNDNAPRPTHEIYASSGAKRAQKIVGVGGIILVILGGTVLFNYSKSGTEESVSQKPAPQEVPSPVAPPSRTYWYSDGGIADMTFASFLGAKPEQTHAVAGLFLSGTLWIDRLDPATDHEELRPSAAKLVTQTVLLVASDTPLDAKIADIFAGIIEKPENRTLLGP